MTDPRSAAAHAADLVRGGRVPLVVAQLRAPLLVVAGELAAHDVPFRMITGSVPAEERQAVLALSRRETIAVLGTDAALSGLAFGHAELVHADDPESLRDMVLLQRLGRVNRPWTTQRVALVRRSPAGAVLPDGDRAARLTAQGWHSGAGSPLAQFAATGAISDVTELLAEIDVCLDGAAAIVDLYPEEDVRPGLEALREYVLTAGPRPAVPGWAASTPTAA